MASEQSVEHDVRVRARNVGGIDEAEVSLPPGVTSGKVTNISAVFSAQDAALSDTGFVYDMEVRNSSQVNFSRFDLRIANDTRATTLEISAPGLGTVQEYYRAPDEAGILNGTAEPRQIAYGSGPTSLGTTTAFVVAILALYPQGYVGGLEWQAAGVYTTSSGEQRLVLRANSQNESTQAGGFFAPSLVGEGQTLQDVTGRMEVTSEGVIRFGNVSARIQRSSGEVFTKGMEFSISPLQRDSIQRPDWLDEPPKPGLSVEENDRLLVYEYTGQQALEAGTNLSVGNPSAFGAGGLGNVTLDQRVTQGDTVYVYKTGEGTSATPTVSVNERPSLPDGATAFTGAVSVTVRVGNFEIETGVRIDSSG